MAKRAIVLGLLCLYLTTITNGFPVDGPEVHEPVPAAEVPKEPENQGEQVVKILELPVENQEDKVREPTVEKQEDKVREQSAPVEQPAADEVHEPVYPDKELPVASQDPSSSEESKEVPSGPEVSFSQYDEDGDGYIDIFEWERKIEDELAKKKFLDADSNDDEKISQEEYQIWNSPAAPQENVNEVYVPSNIVVQPVDEPLPPVGRSADEDGDEEKVVIVGDLEPQASADLEQPAPEVSPAVVVEKDLIQEQPAQPQGQDVPVSEVVAVVEDASQPAIVLLDDKKPEVPVVAASEEAKPALKSVDELPSPFLEEVKVLEEKREEVSPSSSEAPLPVKEESGAVESEEKPKEEVKAEPAQPEVAIKSDSVVPELVKVAPPEVVDVPVKSEVVEEKKPEVASEEKKPEVAEEEKVEITFNEETSEVTIRKVAQPEKQPEVVVSEEPKLPEVAEKKPQVAVSEEPKLPEVPERKPVVEEKLPEEVKKAEVSKAEEKPSNVISSS